MEEFIMNDEKMMDGLRTAVGTINMLLMVITVVSFSFIVDFLLYMLN